MSAPLRIQLGGIRPRVTSLPKKGRKPGKGRRRKLIRMGIRTPDDQRIKRKWLRNWQPVSPKEQSRERTIADVFPKPPINLPRGKVGKHSRI